MYYIYIIIGSEPRVRGCVIKVTCYYVTFDSGGVGIVDAILVANPPDGLRGQQFACATHAQMRQLVAMRLHPTLESLVVHSRCFCHFTLIYALHSPCFFLYAKVRKIIGICKKNHDKSGLIRTYLDLSGHKWT